ncbi:hypothetical protein [Solibacillus sp. CAU 1738]|uniref:hypothetical protein n=1 Tax=Solibacillus sp. CAU 1738 TaxID=3140363 RepID=UPI003260B4E7
MTQFYSFHGTVTKISDFMVTPNDQSGCNKLFTVTNNSGAIVNFVVSPTTYVVDHTTIVVGDRITGYYDGNAPVPLIYPPQYQALVIVKDHPHQNVKVDFFNSRLISSDGQLQLNLSPFTQLLLTNSQAFIGNPANRNLIVIYGATTRSIPAQTTPMKIIVLC